MSNATSCTKNSNLVTILWKKLKFLKKAWLIPDTIYIYLLFQINCTWEVHGAETLHTWETTNFLYGIVAAPLGLVSLDVTLAEEINSTRRKHRISFNKQKTDFNLLFSLNNNRGIILSHCTYESILGSLSEGGSLSISLST